MSIKICKLCQAGVVLRNGEHWIVKSIVPAKITIKKCAAVPKVQS